MMTTDPAILQDIEKKILAWCRAQVLLPAGCRIIVACSGGADSMALLRLLLRRGPELGITVAAAHVDHGIRGEAAHADAAFVRDLCQEHGVPFYLYDALAAGVAVPAHASEEWARRLRYGFLDELAAREGARIATAHTANDQAETLLLRMARGTGVRGLAGIPPRRGAYVRPLLPLTRAETEAYCAALGQSYVVDTTNNDPSFARNRLRQQALPALAAVNPQAVKAIGRLAGQMRELDAWLGAEADALLQTARKPEGWRCETLLAAPAPVLQTALCKLLAAYGHPQQNHVELLLAALRGCHGAVQPAKGVTLCVAEGLLREEKALPLAPQPDAPRPVLPGEYDLPGGYHLALTVLSVAKYENFIKNGAKCKKDLTCCADYAKISRNVLLRTRRPGDRFAPKGRGGHKSLKKFLNEQGIPPAQRALLPLLADGSEVLWLWGLGLAEGLAPGPDTKEVLLVQGSFAAPPQEGA